MANGNGNSGMSGNASSNVNGNKKPFNLTRNQIIIIVLVVVLLLLTGIVSIDLGGVRTMLMNLWNNLFGPKPTSVEEKTEEKNKNV